MVVREESAGREARNAWINAPLRVPSALFGGAWPPSVRRYPGAGVSRERNRTRLYAAVVKVKIQPTIAVPR